MSTPIKQITGTGAVLLRANIDTDQIMPKQFLKRVERSGFGPFIFRDWRVDGRFVLDDPTYAGASILVTGANFGCGSSREQAVWGLLDHGITAVVASSFAPIFVQNAARSRLLTVELSPAECRHLASLITAAPTTQFVIDIDRHCLVAPDRTLSFDLDQRTREAFLLGIDEIERTLQMLAAIESHETDRPLWLPRTLEDA